MTKMRLTAQLQVKARLKRLSPIAPDKADLKLS
jgi:hypothetical protein